MTSLVSIDARIVEALRRHRIWIPGANGMVARALIQACRQNGLDVVGTTRQELDLLHGEPVRKWIDTHRPTSIILAAAKVGGIKANADAPADFLYENLMIEANVIHGAFRSGVEKLLFLGSSCIYPKHAAQPIEESALLTAPLEPTNEGYAIAKIAGVKLCEYYKKQYGCAFMSAMPTNLYGPHDHFDPQKSHVIPAMILKMHAAKRNNAPSLSLWGTGTPLREFLHVSDLARACLTLLADYDGDAPVNIGSGQECSISSLAATIKRVVAYPGEILFDPRFPDGTPRKRLDTRKMESLGWAPQISLEAGLKDTYAWFLSTFKESRP